MRTEAEIVRTIVAWAERLVLLDEAGRTSLPGPRLAQIQLGRLLARRDMATALAIVRDMGLTSDMERMVAVQEVLHSRAEDDPPLTPRRHRAQQVQAAYQVQERLRSVLSPADRRLVSLGSSAATWKSLEQHYPGRSWESLRDDFEKKCLSFWSSEKLFLCKIVDAMYKLDRRGEVRS